MIIRTLGKRIRTTTISGHILQKPTVAEDGSVAVTVRALGSEETLSGRAADRSFVELLPFLNAGDLIVMRVDETGDILRVNQAACAKAA